MPGKLDNSIDFNDSWLRTSRESNNQNIATEVTVLLQDQGKPRKTARFEGSLQLSASKKNSKVELHSPGLRSSQGQGEAWRQKMIALSGKAGMRDSVAQNLVHQHFTARKT